MSANRAESRPGGNWFIAWPLRCPALERALPPPAEGLRLLAPADWHVTAVFLGAVDEARAWAAWRCAAADPPPPVAAGFAELATAGASRAPACVLTLAAGHDVCADWMRRRQAAIAAAAGLEAPRRAPWPHLTLARPRRSAVGMLQRWAAERPYADLTAPLDRLALFGRGDSGPGRYAIVDSMQLGNDT